MENIAAIFRAAPEDGLACQRAVLQINAAVAARYLKLVNVRVMGAMEGLKPGRANPLF